MSNDSAAERYPYIYFIYGKKGVGVRVYIGEVAFRSRIEVERICIDLEEKLKDTFPRGMGYEMMEYDVALKRRF